MFNLFKRRNMDSIKQACCDYAAHLGAIAAQGYHDAGEAFAGRIVFDEAKWITVHPNGKGYNNNGEKIKGTPILIDSESGAVLGGAGGKFTGKHISEMPKRGANAIQAQHDIARAQQKNADPEGFAKRQKELIAKRDQQVKAMQEAAAQKKAEAERMAKEAQEKQAKEQAAAQERAKEQQQTKTNANPLKMDTADLLKACALPFKGTVSKGLNLKGVNLGRAWDLVKTPEEREIVWRGKHALSVGPDIYARYELKRDPSLEIDDTRLQTAFNKLQANMCAAQTLKILHEAGELVVPQETLDLADKLKAQYDQVREQYIKKTAAHNAIVADGALKRLQTMLSNGRSEDALLKEGAMRCVNDIVSQYKRDHSYGYPIFYEDLREQKFECENPNTAAWLKLASIRASIRAWEDYLPDTPEVKNLKRAVSDQLGQAEQMIKLLDNCTVGQALTREYSKYKMRTDPLQSTHEATPKAIGSGSDQAAAGKPMDEKQANELRGNPHFKESEIIAKDKKGKTYKPYHVNCQSCVVAYELRRRGYDVEALPNYKALLGEEEGGPQMLSHNTVAMWYNPETGAWPDITNFPLKDYSVDEYPESLERRLDNLIKPGQRFHISWDWDMSDSGHIVTVEKDKDGNLTIYDPQCGEDRCSVSRYFSSPAGLYVRLDSIQAYRVDNCEIMTNFANKVLVKAGGKAIKR